MLFEGSRAIQANLKPLGEHIAGSQVVTAKPEVHVRQLTAASHFLILACDGIWEVLSDQEVCALCGWLLSASIAYSLSSAFWRIAVTAPPLDSKSVPTLHISR